MHAGLLAAIQDIVEQHDVPLELDALEAELGRPVNLPATADSLASFIRNANDKHLAWLPVGRGFVFDPTRHDPWSLTMTDDDRIVPSPPLQSLVETVFAVTECPRLLPERYKILFAAIARALASNQFDLSGEYGLQELTWAVEDICAGAGVRLARDTIQYVITTLDDHVDWPASAGPHTSVRHLAEVYAASLQAHCADNRVELSDAERILLRLWIGAESEQDEVVPVDDLVPAAPADNGLDLAGPVPGDLPGLGTAISGQPPGDRDSVGVVDDHGVATVETALDSPHPGGQERPPGA